MTPGKYSKHKTEFKKYIFPESGHRPADLMFPPNTFDAIRKCLDVTVTSPFNSRDNFDNSHLLRAEVEKGRKYLGKCNRLNLHFTPFALGCFGRLGPAAIKFVDILASVTANHKNISVAAARSEIISKVCFTTMKFTAAAILDRQLPGQLALKEEQYRSLISFFNMTI